MGQKRRPFLNSKGIALLLLKEHFRKRNGNDENGKKKEKRKVRYFAERLALRTIIPSRSETALACASVVAKNTKTLACFRCFPREAVQLAYRHIARILIALGAPRCSIHRFWANRDKPREATRHPDVIIGDCEVTMTPNPMVIGAKSGDSKQNCTRITT